MYWTSSLFKHWNSFWTSIWNFIILILVHENRTWTYSNNWALHLTGSFGKMKNREHEHVRDTQEDRQLVTRRVKSPVEELPNFVTLCWIDVKITMSVHQSYKKFEINFLLKLAYWNGLLLLILYWSASLPNKCLTIWISLLDFFGIFQN